jgi:hypothetical protein
MNAADPIGCIVSGQAGEKRGFSPDHLFVRRISAGRPAPDRSGD